MAMRANLNNDPFWKLILGPTVRMNGLALSNYTTIFILIPQAASSLHPLSGVAKVKGPLANRSCEISNRRAGARIPGALSCAFRVTL